jgi:hypothetical protein
MAQNRHGEQESLSNRHLPACRNLSGCAIAGSTRNLSRAVAYHCSPYQPRVIAGLPQSARMHCCGLAAVFLDASLRA